MATEATEVSEKEEYLTADFTDDTDCKNSFGVLEAEFSRSELLTNLTSSATDAWGISYLHNPF